MDGNGLGIKESLQRESKLLLISFISIVAGLVSYLTGFLMYSYAWHRFNYYRLGEDVRLFYEMMEWGQWIQGLGIVLVILGMALIAFGLYRLSRNDSPVEKRP